MPLTTLAILEDDATLRATLVDYFTVSNGYLVSYSGISVVDFVSRDFDEYIDFILLDIHLSSSHSLDSISSIRQKHRDANIIIITGDTSDDLVLRAIEGGAKGFLYKPFSLSDIHKTFDSINKIGSYLQPNVVSKLVQSLNDNNSLQNLKERFELTERETDILYLTKLGLSYKEVGEKLDISFHTVNHHMKNIYFKMGVTSKSQLLSKYL